MLPLSLRGVSVKAATVTLLINTCVEIFEKYIKENTKEKKKPTSINVLMNHLPAFPHALFQVPFTKFSQCNKQHVKHLSYIIPLNPDNNLLR